MPDEQGFSVDPRIFRELGELLVKRNSIALTELLKNAYDADATRVRVFGENLADEHGRILIADNGVGMTNRQFSSGFLRIASRNKDTETRRSQRFERRFTGEKGVGRLSAHKLGAVLDVQSIAMSDLDGGTGRSLIRARIDWDKVEASESLTGLKADALAIQSSRGKARAAGTTISVSRLRGTWDTREIQDFVIEADLFEPPAVLLSPIHTLVGRKLIFTRPRLRDSLYRDDAFSVELDGDFETGDALWQDVPNSAWWIVEIDSTATEVHYIVAPTKKALAAYPDAQVLENHWEHVDPNRPVFQARIFAREYAPTGRGRQFTDRVSGIRVYMEGFRISPYGEQGDDWLGLDGDYARRSNKLRLDLPNLRAQAGVEREGLRTLPNTSYVGAVMLTHKGAPDLEAPVDREGFLPSRQLDTLADVVRAGTDLLTRERARLGITEVEQRGAKRSMRRQVGQGFLADEIVIRDGLAQAADTARDLRATLSAAHLDERAVDEFVTDLDDLAAAAERSVEDRSLLRVLAGAGTQMAAFVHEIENVVSATATLDVTLERLIERHPDVAPSLDRLRSNLATIRRQVERQAGYLTDVATVEARRRRQRFAIGERIARAWDLVEPAAERLEVSFVNEAGATNKTSPMFRAEVAAVLTNVMTNAVKAAGRGGKIRAITGQTDKRTWLRLENSGRRVDPSDGERWFLPFESTTLDRIDPLLGQGMGLGLPITRSILEDYGATIHFVEPSAPEMSTCIEIVF